MTDDSWPVDLRGITESVVTTLGPNGRWNVAALGLHAPTTDEAGQARGSESVTARTWGRTRTWRNFREEGEGYVQFTRDPELFVAAALTVQEADEPVLDEADAWVRVEVDRRGSGTSGDTEWVEWSLSPVESTVLRRVVPTFNRGYAAVIEATVHASRLDVDEYDSDELRERIDYCRSVVERCGGEAERRAFESLERVVGDDV
ncbi:DUF447 domain-containing protein [Halobacteriales archaeon QH_7_66_37]|nr:MAG: DUF447 domain-containing protein [Halobacteriales archaeon QH_7_66_37]